MLSSRSSKEDDRIKKMREEAMKRRRKEAGAVKLPHVPRSECRVGDPGFVSRKVAPNDEDDLSALLKNGLIDYRELLGTFRTREDYRYLGIDNIPGTPEVNIPHFEKLFESSNPAPRLNGVKLIKDDNASNSVAILSDNIKQEPSSPTSIANDAQRHNSPSAATCSKQLSMSVLKKEPVSPKCRTSQPVSKTSSIQSNGDVVGRSRTTQPKSKPSILKMPFNSSSPLDPNDKTQRANPSKIESIVKEMTEIFPPLTDIQTPVKAHETLFPFPHLPVSKDNINTLAISGEQLNHGKSDEILKRDLVVTSDDDSDEENERNRASKADPVFLPTNRRLSTTSSSSSDGSSSDSSSESESSDSENESKDNRRQKVENRNAVIRSSHSELTNGDETAVNSPLPTTQGTRHGQLKPAGKVTPKGKVLREEELEKQVSPLNSISKDAKKEPEISPMRNELPTISNFNHSDADLLNTCPGPGMQKSLNSTMSPEKFDNLSNCPTSDGNMHDVDQELRNGDYEPFSYLDGDLMFDKPEDLIPPNFDSDSLVAMIGRSPDRFDPMNLPMVEGNDLSAPSTVNIDHIISPGFDTDQSALKERIKGGKKSGKIQLSFPEDEDCEEFLTSGSHSISSSTPMQCKVQTKKDKEQKWFDTIFSPKRKTFDVPYIDVEELISPVKGPNSVPLKVQIPLSKIHHPGKKVPRLKNTVNNQEVPKRQKVKGKDINIYANKKAKSKDNDKSKAKAKANNSVVTTEKPRQSVGKDIEQIKSLMRELSSQENEDEGVPEVISTPSPLKSASKPEARVSGKSIRGTPVSYIAKKEQTPRGAINSENSDKTVGFEKSKDTCKKTNETKKGASRKRSSSSLSHGDTEEESTRVRTSKKHKSAKSRTNDTPVSRPVLEHNDDSNTGFRTPTSVVSNHAIGDSKLFVSIKLSELKRFPGIAEEEEDKLQHSKNSKKEMDGRSDAAADVNSVAGPVWKPPPNIKIPRITKQPEDEANHKSIKTCSDGNQDCADTDTSSTCSSSCKPSKETGKSRKNRPINEGRGVKRREWERNSKSGNANVCGMCGSLQKDSGRDPIRLGAYKTSYGEYLNLGKRSKHRADCLDASERAPKYIDAVLKYIQYLVGLEITGKTGTKNGFEEYMCITSQCIDLVDFVVNQYGKKENNNISNYDSRFVYLCLRLQSVLYFKLYAAKKDSAARYSKLLSEYFKVHRSPHRVNIKGSTGTPSPMSPTSSHTGSVASFGSSVSNGSYEKMLNLGSVVSIPTETFERMQQYFTYTKYLLHGHRLWDDADAIANQCQEFINVVSRRVGAITIQSSMLHLVDYISTGLQVIKDTEAC